MLTPLATKDEDETKIPSEYYPTHYTPQHHQYYYHPVTFNDESNNLHHSQTPNLYDPSQYYTLSPGYSHSQVNTRTNEDESNNQLSSTMYMPIYPSQHPHHHHHRHHYSSDEMIFPSKTVDQQPTAIYDYNLSPVSTIPPNQLFHQHQNYIPTTLEQTACTTSNIGDYLAPYVSHISDTFRYDEIKPFGYFQSPLNGACRSDSIIVELVNRPLWVKFAPHTLENIITKSKNLR